ncbi:hypothetical protein MOSE0_K03378 [Monosporozyma servazzii]
MSPLQPPEQNQQQPHIQQIGVSGSNSLAPASMQYQHTENPMMTTSPFLQYGQNWVPQQQNHLSQPQFQTQQFQTLQPQQQSQSIPAVENGSQQYLYYYAQPPNSNIPPTQQQLQRNYSATYQYMPQLYMTNSSGTSISGPFNNNTTSTISDANILQQQQQQQNLGQNESNPKTSYSPTNTTASTNNRLTPLAHSYQLGPITTTTVDMQNHNTPQRNSPPNEMIPTSINGRVINENGVLTQNMEHPRMITTMWEDENTLCYQVEANNVSVVRRADNDMINGTKLLNVTKMTRGRRDGILRGEKIRNVVKIGSMRLKGVWIPFERAYLIAEREKIVDLLYPLFVKDINSLLKQTTTAAQGFNTMIGVAAGGAITGLTSMPESQFQTRSVQGTMINSGNQLIPMQISSQSPYHFQTQYVPTSTAGQFQTADTFGSMSYNIRSVTPASSATSNSAPLAINSMNNSSSFNIESNNSTNSGAMNSIPLASYNSNAHRTEQYNSIIDNSGSQVSKLKSIVGPGTNMTPIEPEYVELRTSRKVHNHKKHSQTGTNVVDNKRNDSNSSVTSNDHNGKNSNSEINNCNGEIQSQVVGMAQGENIIEKGSSNTTDSGLPLSDTGTIAAAYSNGDNTLPKMTESSSSIITDETSTVNSRNDSDNSNNYSNISIPEVPNQLSTQLNIKKEDGPEKPIDKTNIKALMT